MSDPVENFDKGSNFVVIALFRTYLEADMSWGYGEDTKYSHYYV